MDATTIVRLAVLVRNALKYLPFVSPEDPQTIREKYNTRIVARVRKKYGAAEADSKGNLPRDERMRAWADWYRLRAQVLWGRPNPRDSHRSAWLYASAGELYEDVRDLRQAEDCYHFAAHGFRGLDSLAQSLKFYERAAQVARTLGDNEWTIRSLRRAKKVAAEMADDPRVAEIEQSIAEAIKSASAPQLAQISN